MQPAADFSMLKTYDWIPNEQGGLRRITIDNNELTKSIETAVDHALQAKGYLLDLRNPDFLISYYLVIEEKTDVIFINNYYSRIGYVPKRSSTLDHKKLIDVTYERGTLVLDIIDNKNKQRIWNGTASSRIGYEKNPEKQIQTIKKAVNKILKKFPPG